MQDFVNAPYSLGANSRLLALRQAIPYRELNIDEPESEITNHEIDFMMAAARNMPRYDCPIETYRRPTGEELAFLLRGAHYIGLTTQLIAFCWYGDYDKSAGLLRDFFDESQLGRLADEHVIVKVANDYRGEPCYGNLEYLINDYLNTLIPHNFQCEDDNEVWEEAERIASDFCGTIIDLEGYSEQETDSIRDALLNHTILFINSKLNPEEPQDSTLFM